MTDQNEDVIDLTVSFSLAGHQNMKGVIIDLSDSNSDTQTEHSVITPRPGKRRDRPNEIAISTPSAEISIYDLCTPDDKVKKKAESSMTAQEPTRSTPKKKKPNNDTDLKHCCPICLDSFGASPLASTKCGHVFCFKCITMALKTEPKCPTCRRKLKGASAVHPIFL